MIKVDFHCILRRNEGFLSKSMSVFLFGFLLHSDSVKEYGWKLSFGFAYFIVFFAVVITVKLHFLLC